MFEELVSDVKGEWYKPTEALQLTWTMKANGITTHTYLSWGMIGALSTWLAQPKEPTAAEIAARLVERWDRNTDLAEASWGEKLADLERHIAAVIEAERAREGAT